MSNNIRPELLTLARLYLPWRLAPSRVFSFFYFLFFFWIPSASRLERCCSTCFPTNCCTNICLASKSFLTVPKKNENTLKIGKFMRKKNEKTLISESGSENSRYAFIELMDYICVKTAAHVFPSLPSSPSLSLF